VRHAAELLGKRQHDIDAGDAVASLLLSALSIVQYRRSVATLRTVEIPPGYWVNLSVYASAVIGLLGVALALYLAVG
jgi:hypothetical protein